MSTNQLQNDLVLAADIGGSHITAALIDLKTRSLLAGSLIRKQTDAQGSAGDIIQTWLRALEAVEQVTGKKSPYLAISMPGPFDYANGISLIKGMNKYEALYGLNVKEIFARHLNLQNQHVWFVNDAQAFLRGEVLWGSGRGADVVFGITLGTGLGSALYAADEVLDLNLGSSPFKEGIAEDYLSTRGLLRYYREQGGATASNIQELSQEQMRAENGPASFSFQKLSEWLGGFLALHLPKLRPDVVVIGGNISRAHGLFLPALTKILASSKLYTPIRIAETGEHAAMMGAATYINKITDQQNVSSK